MLTLLRKFPAGGGAVTLQAGNPGTLPVSGQPLQVPSGIVGYVLYVTQANGVAGGWNNDGSDAISIDRIKASYDGGATFVNLTTPEIVKDVQTPAINKGTTSIPANTAVISAHLQPEAKDANGNGIKRLIALDYTPIKTVDVTAQVFGDNGQ